jgi:hypothetical protein
MTLRKITQMYIAIYVLAYTKLWIIYGKCNVKFQKLNIQTNTNVGISMSKENFQILWTKKVPIFPNIMNKKNSRYYEHKCFKIFEQTPIPMNKVCKKVLKFTIFYLFFLMCILFRKLFFILTCRTNVSTNFQHSFIINVLLS